MLSSATSAATVLDEADAHGMLSWQGSGGFSIDASVRIEGEDRAGVERPLRYCEFLSVAHSTRSCTPTRLGLAMYVTEVGASRLVL